MNIEECFSKVPLFWQKTAQSGVIPRLCALMDREPEDVLGVSACMNGQDFDYYIAVATDQETPEDMTEYHIPNAPGLSLNVSGPCPMPYKICKSAL